MVSVLDAAREAYRAGLCVLPVREDGTKAPAVSSWRAFQTTRPTLEAMRQWDFATRTGFGVVAGEIPSIKIGASVRVPIAALRAWIDRQIAAQHRG